MSGIIGGAGSRSGVIGQTEIEYEEGSWTPTAPNLKNTSVGKYVRIGDMVCCSGWVQTEGGATNNQIGGLPFQSASSGNAAWGGSTCYQNISTADKRQIGLLMANNGTTMTMYDSNTLIAINNGSQLHFQLMYEAA